MAARDVPEPWAGWLIRAGLTDPRNDKRASMSRLAEAADIHATTVGHAMYGTRRTSPETAAKIADALVERLRVKDPQRRRREILHVINDAYSESTPFRLHPDADLLDDTERKVVNDLIGLLARSKQQQPGEVRTLHLLDEAAYDPEDDDDKG